MLRTLFMVCLCALLLACAGSSVERKEDNFRIADTNMRLGVGYLQQGRVDDALEKLQKALKAVPDFPEAHSSIALVYERLNDKENAAHHYEQALKLKPEDGATQNNYAVFLCQQGEIEKAEGHFLQALNSRGYETPAQAWENLGVCALRIPDIEQAEVYLRKALKIESKLPVALLSMARISLEKQRYMSGRAYLQRYQEVRTLGPDALWLRIQVEVKLGNKVSVRDYVAQLLNRHPDANETRLMQNAGYDKL